MSSISTYVSPSVASMGGNVKAIVVFVFMLVGFVVESELTQYVQTSLEYRHPYFLFWVVHSSFAIIFPLHLLYLTLIKKYSTESLRNGLSIAITNHLAPASTSFPQARFLALISIMTIGLTAPGLMWFAAVSLAPIADVTAIWNTNAFFAYLITVKLFGMKFETRKLIAVLMATVGVLIMVYGDSSPDESAGEESSPAGSSDAPEHHPTAPLLGNLLTLGASLGYGAYQALYKRYAALPDDPEVIAEGHYQPLAADGDEESNQLLQHKEDASSPPPFGLHPNLMTSAVGLATLVVFWFPIPVLHFTGIEPFALPHSWRIVISICGIAAGGVVFNSALMILLAEWGAIITSVGNLLTIILVMVSDVFFGAGIQALTIWSVLGSSIISVSFGVLALGYVTQRRPTGSV
ncbi:hypothetical protein DL96DRAFT_1573645, partial [Flagelloscypha sp. PMI_526]